MQQNPLAFLALMRPLNCLIAALSVYVGAFTIGLRWPTFDLGIAALSAALIAAAGNAFNDVRDVAIDRINRPTRPLPAGKLSERAALYFCYAVNSRKSQYVYYVSYLYVALCFWQLSAML